MVEDDGLNIWTICKYPSDYPDKYVARRHVITAQGHQVTTSDFILNDDIEPLRDAMMLRGLICIGRMEQDDPVIVESWL